MNVPYSGTVLKVGSRGDPVYACKRAMHKAGQLDRIGYRRFYGPRFAGAVEAFQTANNLTPDGRIGRQTLQALEPFFDNYGYLLYTGRYPGVPALQLPETFVPTHQTGGLDGFPAIDCFAVGGTDVLAPENVSLVWPHFIPWDQTAHVGGWTCYLQAETGNATYFVTHFNDLAKRGFYAKGMKLGTVAAVPHQWWPSHIHEGKHKGRYQPPQS